MAGFDGAGRFVRSYNWVDDKSSGIKISYNRADAEDGGIADGLSNVLTKDGQQTATGPVSFASGLRTSDGTAAVPAITFINDPDTGIYRIGANNIALSAGGTKVIDIATAAVATAITGALALRTPLAVASGGLNSATTDSVRLSYTNADTNDAYSQFNTNSSSEIRFNTIDHDTNSLAATATTAAIVVKKTGTYLIVTNTGVDVTATADAQIYLYKNGGATTLDSTNNLLMAGTSYITSNVIKQLTAGDTIGMTIQAFRTPVATVTVIGPTLSAVRLSD